MKKCSKLSMSIKLIQSLSSINFKLLVMNEDLLQRYRFNEA